jgi:hypothetical protein
MRGCSRYNEADNNYKSCKNTDIINCKRQEIKQLINGAKPEQYCYDKGYLVERDNQGNNTLLTFQKAMERMAYFKQYYIDEVDELTKAESKMKSPYGERITMAELYNNVETKSGVSITINKFIGDNGKEYDVSRYCREANCVSYKVDDKGNYIYDGTGQRVCNKYEFNGEDRVCKMDCKQYELSGGNIVCKANGNDDNKYITNQEYYTYGGDGATFYYSADYNADNKAEAQIVDQSDSKCNISEENINKEAYGGLIPIGEVVDYTEEWGTEVARQIKAMIDEVNGIANVSSTIADFPTTCECGANCQQSVPISCCSCPTCKDCCPDVYCQGNECSSCEARDVYRDADCNTQSVEYYTGCLTCGKHRTQILSSKPLAKPDYYVCPFGNMCNSIRDIYQTGTINDNCFTASKTDTEEANKNTVRENIGYLTKFEIREKKLFELSGLTTDNGTFTAAPATLFPELDCLTGCDAVVANGLSCETSSSKTILDRFTLLNMLKTSRERLTGCVKGYSFPYKQNANNVRIYSCYEADDTSVTILPEFPYPNTSAQKYINCYPYNSNELSVTQQQICFYNINRTGTADNPGCLTITKNYMDNYYCCQ